MNEPKVADIPEKGAIVQPIPDIDAEALLRAIASDDKGNFDALLRDESGTMNKDISLGRFSLLGVLYLYRSRRLIRAYEKELLRIDDHRRISEPVELYLRFKKVSGRSLRLYVPESGCVSPLEMLAILDERDRLADIIDRLHPDERQLGRIAKIYRLTHGVRAEQSGGRLRIPEKPLSRWQYACICLFVMVAIGGILMGALSPSVLKNRFGGDGSENNPMYVRDDEKLINVLENVETYSELLLCNDMIVEQKWDTIRTFDGVIDGDGHTIYLQGGSSGAMFQQFKGTMKNLVIIIEEYEAELTGDGAVIAVNNSGTIQNVSVKGSIALSENISDDDPDDDVYPNNYFGAFAAYNSGEISGCRLDCDIAFEGNGSGNMYLGGIVGVNNGSITGCETATGREIICRTVDIGGIAAENKGGAVIKDCINNALLCQTSDVDSWLPNVGGIVCTNAGEVENCANIGELSSISTVSEKKGENLLEVYLGGIACTNKSVVRHCLNKGDLNASSGIYSVYVGGIVCTNTYDVKDESTVFGEVEECGSTGRIALTSADTSDEDHVYMAGGICAFGMGKTISCYSTATYKLPEGVYAGGIWGGSYITTDVLGMSSLASMQNCAYLADGKIRCGQLYGNATLEQRGIYGTDNGSTRYNSEIGLRESEVFWE